MVVASLGGGGRSHDKQNWGEIRDFRRKGKILAKWEKTFGNIAKEIGRIGKKKMTPGSAWLAPAYMNAMGNGQRSTNNLTCT